MGPVRSEVMWQAVLDAVQACLDAGSGPALDVLDLGGGTGGDAVRLAAAGHRVTVVDPSPDALASLSRRALEAGLPADAVRGVLGDTVDLADHVPARSLDLVLCHGVLEHVDDHVEALGPVAAVLRPGAHVSVVVAGRHAAVLAKALGGDFDGAQALFTSDAASWDVRSAGPRRFVAQEVLDLLAGHGLAPVQSSALRVFADLVPSAVVDVEPGARERLFALERLVRGSTELAAISGGLQTIARLDLSPDPSHRGGPRATV